MLFSRYYYITELVDDTVRFHSYDEGGVPLQKEIMPNIHIMSCWDSKHDI